MYIVPSASSQTPYQGDIINDFPFFNIASVKSLSIKDRNIAHIEDGINTATRNVLIEANLRKIMLISQTCDAQRRENVIICPVYTVAEYMTSNNPNKDKLDALRNGKNYYWFYLPAYETVFVESFVDFQQFTYLPKELYEQFQASRLLQLDDLGRHRLAWSISTYFGRPL